MAKNPELRLIINFVVEPKPGQSDEDALTEIAKSLADTISDPNSGMYTNYDSEVEEAKSTKKKGSGYNGPYVIGVTINRQEATNKPFIRMVEKTIW